MTEQYMQIQWLQDTEEIFDRVQLKPSNKYLAVQSYLKGTADTWFRLHKSNIPDWFTFKKEILEVFKASFNRTSFTVEQQPVVHRRNYSSLSPDLKLSSVIDRSSSDSNTRSLSSEIIPLPLPISNANVYQQPDIVVLPEQSSVSDRSASKSDTQSSSSPQIRTLPLSTPVLNTDQQSDMVTLSEQSSSHQSVNTESITKSTVDTISHMISSTITNILPSCSSTVTVNSNTPHEAELKQLESDEINSCSMNEMPVINSEFISRIVSMKRNVQVNYRDKSLAAYDTRDFIYRMITTQDFLPAYRANI
ncbi:unnamed protein product, partial [Rotaria socialis]